MTTATIRPLENAVSVANHWLSELSDVLGHGDHQQAYRALRAVLMTLRDRMPVEEATDLGAQLPLMVRGVYYESWNPSKTPRAEGAEEFLDHIASSLQQPNDGSPEDVARAVFALLAQHITEGEVRHIKSNLPADIKTLWP